MSTLDNPYLHAEAKNHLVSKPDLIRNFMPRFILGVILLTIASSATAQQDAKWHIISSSKQQIALMESNYAKKINGNPRAWIAFISSNPTLYIGKQITTSKSLIDFDCEQDRFRTLTGSYYDIDGNVIGNVRIEPSDWQYNSPGTTASSLVGVACGREETSKQLKNGFDPVVNAREIVEILLSHM